MSLLKNVLELLRPDGYLLIYVRNTEAMKDYREQVMKITEELQQRGVIKSVERQLFDLYQWRDRVTHKTRTIKAKLTVFSKS